MQVRAKDLDDGVWGWKPLARTALDPLPGNATLPQARRSLAPAARREDFKGLHDLRLELWERRGESWHLLDGVVMAPAVRPSAEAFATGDLDYLLDSDGDGVGDVNERIAGADPADPDSVPGHSVIDVLALYSAGFADLYAGDPTTRIHHALTVADDIHRRSGTGIRLRLVGLVEASVDDPTSEVSSVDPLVVDAELRRHGADLAVMFRPVLPETGSCGWAGLGGWRTRGRMAAGPDGSRVVYATVFGDCRNVGATTAHELGHLMGLEHADPNVQGTFRWSRGHYVDEEAGSGTAMSYGWRFTGVFSDPSVACDGAPCGKDVDGRDGADAVRTLNAVRFQIANYQESKPDADGDGVVDEVDAMPADPSDWRDADGDGVGDAADADDDGDGVEDELDAFPFDAAEWSDRDGDGTGDNADEFSSDPKEVRDTDDDGIGDAADVDDDGDGVPDGEDLYPLDASRVDIGAYVLRGEGVAGAAVALGDGDGVLDLLVGVRAHGAHRGAAYLLSGNDLAAADAADGRRDRVLRLRHVAALNGSWKFLGQPGDAAGADVSFAGDVDGDGAIDLLIGAPHRGDDHSGGAYLLSGRVLRTVDSADGAADGIIHLGGAPRFGAWTLVGEPGDTAGASVAIAGDVDGDGQADVVIGAPGHDQGNGVDAGAAYLVSGADIVRFAASGGVIELRAGVRQGVFRRLVGEAANARAGAHVAGAGDVDGDGQADVLIGTRTAAYLVAGSDALTDSTAGVVHLGEIASRADSWKFAGDWSASSGTRVASAGDVDGDGLPDVLIGGVGSVHLIAGSALRQLDESGVVRLSSSGFGGVRRLSVDGVAARAWELAASRATSIGDIDGDGRADLLVDADGHLGGATVLPGSTLDSITRYVESADRRMRIARRVADPPAGEVAPVAGGGSALLLGTAGSDSAASALHLLPVDDLAILDAVDGDADGRIQLHNVAGDTDDDGLGNTVDRDDDGDGVADDKDAFPLAADEWEDSDGDSTGDHADSFPYDDVESVDTDDDGLGDRADPDDDGDGTVDAEDPHPLDTDNDGVDNDADPDDDGDGIADAGDDLPLHPGEQIDTDGDGVGNNADQDDDGDGTPDADDPYPFDTDNDGLANSDDGDDDGDGVADEEDDAPLDAHVSHLLFHRLTAASHRLIATGVGDIDGDGTAEVAFGVPWFGSHGVVYLLSAQDLAAADRADGVADRLVDTKHIAAQSGSWELLGEPGPTRLGVVVSAGDVDGDGVGDLLFGAPAFENQGRCYVVGGRDLPKADPADGRADGRIEMAAIATQPDSLAVHGSWGDGWGAALAAVGDVDGDGRTDVAIGAPGYFGEEPGNVHLVLAKAMDREASRLDVVGPEWIGRLHGVRRRSAWKRGRLQRIVRWRHRRRRRRRPRDRRPGTRRCGSDRRRRNRGRRVT